MTNFFSRKYGYKSAFNRFELGGIELVIELVQIYKSVITTRYIFMLAIFAFGTHLSCSTCTLQAISVLHQIVLKAPHLPDAYHTLGLVHTAMGDTERALGFYMLAAHLMPKDSSLWKLLVSWST